MGLLRRLLLGDPPAAPPGDWLAARPGDVVPDGRGLPGSLRSVAVYRREEPEAPSGETSWFALLWVQRDRDVSGRLVERDVYPDREDLELLYGFEEIGLEHWPKLPENPRIDDLVTTVHPEHGQLHAGLERVTLTEASGPDAGGCPAEGWWVAFTPPGATDVREPWVVIYTLEGTRRLALRVRLL